MTGSISDFAMRQTVGKGTCYDAVSRDPYGVLSLWRPLASFPFEASTDLVFMASVAKIFWRCKDPITKDPIAFSGKRIFSTIFEPF